MTGYNATDKKETLWFLFHHSKKVMIGLMAMALVILVALGAAALFLKPDPNVIAKVGGTKIYLKDYKEWAFASTGRGTPDSPYIDKYIKDSILNNLIEAKIVDKELAKRNITISQEDITTKAKAIFPEYAKKDELSKAVFEKYAKYKLEQERLTDQVSTWKEGAVLYCRFDRGYQDDVAAISAQSKDNAAKINEHIKNDQSYAEKYCQDMEKRLEAGSTYEKELEGINNDPKIGRQIWQPYIPIFGTAFNKDSYSKDSFSFAYDDYNQISKLKVTQGKPSYSFLIIRENTTDKRAVSYAVVRLSGKGNDGEALGYGDWFLKKKAEYKITTYPERIKV